MTVNENDSRFQQSRKITIVGCIGIIVIATLLFVISGVIARNSVQEKYNAAIAKRAAMRTQLEKVPDIFNRMTGFGCGADVEAIVEDAIDQVNGLHDVAQIGELEHTWDICTDAWNEINRGCRESRNEPAFIDLQTEMEGVRNRYSTEKNNYLEAEEVYNNSLNGLMEKMFGIDFGRLD
jgi:hypothetical protein